MFDGTWQEPNPSQPRFLKLLKKNCFVGKCPQSGSEEECDISLVKWKPTSRGNHVYVSDFKHFCPASRVKVCFSAWRICGISSFFSLAFFPQVLLSSPSCQRDRMTEFDSPSSPHTGVVEAKPAAWHFFKLYRAGEVRCVFSDCELKHIER